VEDVIAKRQYYDKKYSRPGKGSPRRPPREPREAAGKELRNIRRPDYRV